MAFDSHLEQVLEEDVSAEARRTSFAALSRQIEGTRDNLEGQALRMLLLRAAQIAAGRGSAVASDLIRLAMKGAGWLVTPGALEACASLDVPIRVTVRDGPPVDAVIEAQLEALSLPAGPDQEAKYRFTALTRGPDALMVTLAPTTWTNAHTFHIALQRDPAWASKLPDGGWVTPVPFGQLLLPGIAVVHAVIMTSDRQVIAAQRSRETSYAPLHWSVSFEEQLNENDFGRDEDAFTAAAQRGFREEFGAEVPAIDVVPLASVMQVDLLNLGVVMLVRPAMTAAAIRESWRSAARDGWEAADVQCVPLNGLAAAVARLRMHLHPTSELRCLALQRWLSRS